MSIDSGNERRRFVRYSLKATADVVFDNEVKQQADIDNLSTGGMFLKLEYQIPKQLLDKKVHASIRARASGGEVIIEAGCSIVRTEPDGVALFFSSIDSTNRKILHDLIGELNEMVRDSRKQEKSA